MVARVCELPACGATFNAKPAEIAKGAGRFCCRAHAYEARRIARPEHRCAHCGQPSGLRAADVKRGRKYCGQACYGAVKRVHVRPDMLPCAQCGKLYPTSGRAAGTKYCSSRCFGDAQQRPGAPPPCAQCGKERDWTYGRSAATEGPYCSRTCAGLARRARQAVSCQACGKAFQVRDSERQGRRAFHCSRACRNVTAERLAVRRPCGRDGCEVLLRVRPSAIASGEGKYCSLTCRGLARRRRVAFACGREGCSTTVMLRPSEARERRYCSHRCAGLEVRRLHPPQIIRCRGCKKRVTAPLWRQRRFCGNVCANRGRPRRRRPSRVERDRLILELHREGLVSPLIVERLAERAEADPSWKVTAATVRSVIHRAG